MKATFKNIFLSCLAVLTISVNGISANAAEIGGDIPECGASNNTILSEGLATTGVNLKQSMVILEDRLEEIKNDASLSEEDKQKHIEKIEYLIDVRDSCGSGLSTYTASEYTSPYKSKTLAVDFCSQKYNNYCGPATTEQTCKFLKGSSHTQDTIASAYGMVPEGAGCDLQPILDYVNKQTGSSYEQFWLGKYATNFDGCTKIICESINKRIPPILWVSVSETWGLNRGQGSNQDTTKWPYTIGGHYLNASGYFDKGELMQRTDPWLDRISGYKNAEGVFNVDNYTVYMVTNVVCV